MLSAQCGTSGEAALPSRQCQCRERFICSNIISDWHTDVLKGSGTALTFTHSGGELRQSARRRYDATLISAAIRRSRHHSPRITQNENRRSIKRAWCVKKRGTWKRAYISVAASPSHLEKAEIRAEEVVRNAASPSVTATSELRETVVVDVRVENAPADILRRVS